MVTYVNGSLLPPRLQAEAAARYAHRFTGDWKPAWAKVPRPDGTPYMVQFRDDADWLAHTDFPVTKAGRLSDRPSSCRSRPTWPFGTHAADAA